MPVADPSVTIVIPARYASSRFPGKPLALLAGRPVIQHVYEQAARVPHVDRVLVATDDARIHETVRQFGGLSAMITAPCRTGTDRVAEAIRMDEDGRNSPAHVVVNLQADEIPLSPTLVEDLITPFLAGDEDVGTLCRPFADGENPDDPSAVKVVTDGRGDGRGRALYFSRAHIPRVRDRRPDEDAASPPLALLHLGVYIFRTDTLRRFAALPSGVLEQAEQLEQLRALEHGMPVRVWETRQPSLRIDTPEDLAAANKSWDRMMAVKPQAGETTTSP